MLIYNPNKSFTEDIVWNSCDKVYEPCKIDPSTWIYYNDGADVPIFIDPVDERFVYVHTQSFVIRYWKEDFIKKFKPDEEANQFLHGITGKLEP